MLETLLVLLPFAFVALFAHVVSSRVAAPTDAQALHAVL